MEETIEVRGTDPVEIEVTVTHHGPVIAGNPALGSAVALRDPGLVDGTPWLDAVRDAVRSRSVGDLYDALRNWTDRVNNYAVADIHGRYGKDCHSQLVHCLIAGRTPIGERVWDMGRFIDWALDTLNVHARNLLMLGNSGGGMVTAADVSTDGKRLAVLTYTAVWVFAISGGDDNFLKGKASRFCSNPSM